jgi:Fe-S cluster biogenesis protein NfuA
MTIDRLLLDDTITSLSRLIRAHAGGLELVDVNDGEGIVTVRFTGMCVGCELRAVTAEGSVRPALQAVDGVREVRIAGLRISEEAQARLARELAAHGAAGRAVRLMNSAREHQQ